MHLRFTIHTVASPPTLHSSCVLCASQWPAKVACASWVCCKGALSKTRTALYVNRNETCECVCGVDGAVAVKGVRRRRRRQREATKFQFSLPFSLTIRRVLQFSTNDLTLPAAAAAACKGYVLWGRRERGTLQIASIFSPSMKQTLFRKIWTGIIRV